jgi:hypothetical protein
MERAAFHIRPFVKLARVRAAQKKGLIVRDVPIIPCAESLCFMRSIGLRADKNPQRPDAAAGNRHRNSAA